MTNTVSILDLRTADYNPRDITEKNYNKLKDNIKQYGILQPLIVNKNKERKNIIIGGHQRYRIANELGLKKVPVKYLNVDLHTEKKLNLSFNFRELSMGMSSDYLKAARNNSTYLRIGSSIFGHRI